MSPIHVLASTNMGPRQDPHLRIHVSTSLCLRLLCKIHVSGFMSQHPCVSLDPLQDPCLRIHISAAICLSGSSTRSTSWNSCLSIFISQGTLQDPCLRIPVSASLHLRILYKIHVFGFMSQHPLIWSLYKIHVFGLMSQHLCIPGSSARSMSPGPYICTHMPYVSQDPLQDPCLQAHVSASLGPLQDPCLRIHVSAFSIFLSQDPLQDPCLRIHVSGSCLSIHQYGSSARSMSPDSCLSIHMYLSILSPIHVSASLYLRALCKIHVSGFMSQHPYVSQDPLQDPCLRIHISASICISGSSARSMSPDSCLSIHMYLRIPYKIHVSDSCLSIFISQGTLQDPCLRIPVSASLYLRILCKIHVSGSINQHPYVSQDPLQDPVLQAHVSASLHLRILYKIHVFGFMSQHLRISGSSTRSMCPIHVLASRAFFVAMRRENTPTKILFNVSRRRNPHFDLPRRIFCGPGVTQILTSGDAFCVALRRENTPTKILFNVSRRRNAHFDLPRRIFCGPAQTKRKFNLPRRVLCPYHVESRGVTTR